MKFDQVKPCSNCPFRTDVKPYLTGGRATQIVQALTVQQGTFTCHKTLKTVDFDGEPQHCAGALILLEKIERPNQMMRIAERLGSYDRFKLHMDAPVFDSTRAFVKAQKG